MKNQLAFGILCATLCASVVGCTDEQRTYDISVKNDSSHPLTIVLARSDKTDSPTWLTPEQVAHDKPPADTKWGLGVVPPGKTANADKIKDKFESGAKAWVRLYEGELSVGQMLKLPPGSPKRQDIPLQNGDNQIVVRDAGDFIHADRVGN